MSYRTETGNAHLFAVDDLIENKEPETNSEKTETFWKTFGPFVSEYLTGSVDVHIATDGTVDVHFHP